VMGCGGAMRVGKRMQGDEASARRRRRSVRCSESEAEGTRATGAKC
jgi:hypothetical protein